MCQKLLFLLLFFTNYATYASLDKKDNSNIITIEKNRLVCLKDLAQNISKPLFSIKDFPTNDNWKNIKIVDATYIDSSVIEIIITQETINSFLNEKNDMSCMLIFRYDCTESKLIHKEYNNFSFWWEDKVQYHVLIGDSSIGKTKFKSISEFSDIVRYDKTACLSGNFYFIKSDALYKSSNCNEMNIDSSFTKRTQTFIEIEYFTPSIPDNKFCRWGFDGLFFSNDNKILLSTFYNQKSLFAWQSKSVSEIVEYNIETKKINWICNFGRNPSCSINNELILYEKIHKPFGFKKIVSQGYFISNKKTKEVTFVGDFVCAVFLKQNILAH